MGRARSRRTKTAEQRALIERGLCAGKNSTYGKPGGAKHKFCHKITGGAPCRRHGGAQHKGPASPNWKHGRDSHYLPSRYRERAVELLRDPELVSTRKMIAECDLRREELFGQLSTGEAGEVWSTLVQLRSGIMAARADNRRREAADLLNQLFDAIDTGAQDGQVWQEIYGNQEQRRKLSETESRRMERMQAYLTAEQVTALAFMLADLVTEIWREDKERMRVFMERLGELEGWSALTGMRKTVPGKVRLH